MAIGKSGRRVLKNLAVPLEVVGAWLLPEDGRGSEEPPLTIGDAWLTDGMTDEQIHMQSTAPVCK